jgi:integrase
MKKSTSTSSPEQVDSSQAIGALAKERVRMQAQQRYQRGSLTIMKRKGQADVWSFRYYMEENGRSVYKRKIIGTVVEFPQRKDAEKELMKLRVDINEGAAFAPMTVEQLGIHFLNHEVPLKAYATREGYKNIINTHVSARWGNAALSSIKPIEVENWIRGLKRRNGKPASPGTRSKVRNVMSAMFSHAMRYGWATQNPITSVRASSQRLQDPDLLTTEEFRSLLRELDDRERVMVLLAGSTALRRGEMFGLRWEDVDFEEQLVRVTHSIYRSVEGETKTAASHKPVPLPALVVDELRHWKASSHYRGASDYVFPSIQKNGKQPLQPDMILKNHIRPALQRLGIKKKVGWHTFRHGVADLLRRNRVDLKTAQDLLRHANPRILMQHYQQSVTDERRAAQELAFDSLMGADTRFSRWSSDRTHENPRRPQKEEVKPVIN